MTELEAWLLLKKAPQLGDLGFLKVLEKFGTPSAVFKANFVDLKAVKIFKKTTLDWIKNPDLKSIQPCLDWVKKDNCTIVTLSDENYPELLKEITDPPSVLYVLGDVGLLNSIQIGVVGSRNPTQGGVENAYEFSKQLANYDINIISGMAMGIDASAHLGCLEGGAKTLAVCGTGLDRVYPAKHKNLAHQISKQGVLISEFSIGTPPIARNFPRRNRVISGMSLGTLVVEATLKSGSLITARLASEQGREVFAIPSSIHNIKAQGSHFLIKQGAKLVENITDIIEEIASIAIKSNKTKQIINKAEKDELDILKYLSYDVKKVDELVQLSKLNIEIVNQQLMMLELENKIERVDGFGFILRK
jgi:DNA processing protein